MRIEKTGGYLAAKIAKEIGRINEEFISVQDISRLADAIYHDLELKLEYPDIHGRKRKIIIDTVSNKFIYTLINELDLEAAAKGIKNISAAERSMILEPVVRDLIEKLKTKVYQKEDDPDSVVKIEDVAFIEQYLSSSDRTAKLQDTNRYYKEHYGYADFGAPHDLREARSRALQTLDNLIQQEREQGREVDNILFEVVDHDSDYGRIIGKKKELVTLDKLIYSADQQQIKKAYQVLLDCMKGALFLRRHQLLLTDINPYNLALDKESGRGLLFDFDGLYPDGVKMDGRLTIEGYKPPEITKGREHLITEAEMVYQFGLCLRNIRHRDGSSQHYSKEYFDLLFNMVDENPKKRISLEQAVKILEEILPDIVK